MTHPSHPQDRTRGAVSNTEGRFAKTIATREDDGWAAPGRPPDDVPERPTELLIDRSKRIITRNDSPDVPFSQSINPYKGCEHGCIYCFARPTHSYLDLSPGLDFETKIAWKPEAVSLLLTELAKPGYQVSPIAFGTNTDPWQPLERAQRSTRALLELLYECRHPVTVVTKGSLILRDVDLLAKFAQENLVHVMLSITTLDNELKAKLEPRAAAPATRLRAVRELRAAGVPVGVLFAPAIPFINDHEMEAVLEAAAEAGAETAGCLLLRLPYEVKGLFAEWLQTHFPERAARVLAVITDARGGGRSHNGGEQRSHQPEGTQPRYNDPRFHHRQRGEGVFAELLAQRFALAKKKFGYAARSERSPLDVAKFRPPMPAASWLVQKPRAARVSAQGDLFGP